MKCCMGAIIPAKYHFPTSPSVRYFTTAWSFPGHTIRKQGSCLEKEIMQGTMPGAVLHVGEEGHARPGLLLLLLRAFILVGCVA